MENQHPNKIDAAVFDHINRSLLELKSKSQGHTSMLELIDQVVHINNIVNKLFDSLSVPSKGIDAQTELNSIITSHTSHLAGHDQHLEAHDKHLAALTKRLDLLQNK